MITSHNYLDFVLIAAARLNRSRDARQDRMPGRTCYVHAPLGTREWILNDSQCDNMKYRFVCHQLYPPSHAPQIGEEWKLETDGPSAKALRRLQISRCPSYLDRRSTAVTKSP